MTPKETAEARTEWEKYVERLNGMSFFSRMASLKTEGIVQYLRETDRVMNELITKLDEHRDSPLLRSIFP